MVVVVLGGYGDIGRNICRLLVKEKEVQVIALGRDESKAMDILSDIWKDIEYLKNDISLDTDLNQVFHGSQIVINAMGIDPEIEEYILNYCSSNSIKYISCGNAYKREWLEKGIFSAGSMPGLSLLMQRALIKSYGTPESLDYTYYVQDSFSYGAAKDYIEGLFDESKRNMVRYQAGQLIPYVAEDDLQVPFIDATFKKYSFYDRESQYLTSHLDIESGSWSMALCGNRTIKALEEARALYSTNPEKAIDNLCNASSLDTFEHGRFCGICITEQIDSMERNMCIKCHSASELTALAPVICVKLKIIGALGNYNGDFGQIDSTEYLFELLDQLDVQVVNGFEEEELLLGEI